MNRAVCRPFFSVDLRGLAGDSVDSSTVSATGLTAVGIRRALGVPARGWGLGLGRRRLRHQRELSPGGAERRPLGTSRSAALRGSP
ncbi:MAG: hypothetical protein ACK5EA_23890 [Planctomycetaceae bacterium]